ncbi:MAG: ATP-binding protein [Candidatus Auribacterota bacterium]
MNNSSYTLQPSDLHIIINLCRIMNSALHHEPLISKIMQFCTEAMEVEGASILLYDSKIDRLIFYCTTGNKSDQLNKIFLARDEGIAGWVFTNNEPALTNNIKDDPRFAARVDQSVQYTTRSIIATPLNLENRTVGVLELVNKNHPDGFTARDMILAELIAEHTALAIERVKLVQENISNSRLAAIGETVAGLAHYIKNILTALEGSAYIINSTITSDKDYSLVERQWPIVHKSIGRISALALSMLEFSKDRKPTYSHGNVNRVIEELHELVREKAAQKNIEIYTSLDSSIPDTYFDPQGLHRVLLNLLSNSFDACAGVTDAAISITSRCTTENGIEVIVSDTGAGMPQDIIDKIMTSKLVSTKGSKGTGLGIPISRKIINEHKGSFDIKSIPDKGTTISLTLPVLSSPAV